MRVKGTQTEFKSNNFHARVIVKVQLHMRFSIKRQALLHVRLVTPSMMLLTNGLPRTVVVVLRS